jgi:uncharacterized repeat protein (TIGR01451 family)
VTAGAGATNLTLQVNDQNGDFGYATPFNVANYADLALQTYLAPSTPRAGSTLTYTLVVTNMGPGLGAGVVLTNQLPPNQMFLSATSSVGSCSFSNSVVRCIIGNLPANQSATVTITTDPLLPVTATNYAGLTQVNLDPNLANNVSQTVFAIQPPLLYISGPTVVERSYSTTNAVFNIFLAQPAGQAIGVDYATADGTAKAGLNYVATSGHLVFNPPVTICP